jgi:putative transposase
MKDTAKRTAPREEPTRTIALTLTLPAVLQEALHELVIGCGTLALSAMLEADRTALCGERYVRDGDRTATRAGHASGELAMGGRRVGVVRPRVRGKDGREVPLPTWEHFRDQDPLTSRAVEQMLVGVTTRRYARSLEPAPARVKTRGTSKSAVSRRFVKATTRSVGDVLGRDLSALSISAIFIDGIHVAEHVVLVALGVDEQGDKHVLGLAEGATENAAVCSALLANLQERGLTSDRAMLFVIDGSKALAKAIRQAYGARALVQRCQVHKLRIPTDSDARSGRTWTAVPMHSDCHREEAGGSTGVRSSCRVPRRSGPSSSASSRRAA